MLRKCSRRRVFVFTLDASANRGCGGDFVSRTSGHKISILVDKPHDTFGGHGSDHWNS